VEKIDVFTRRNLPADTLQSLFHGVDDQLLPKLNIVVVDFGSLDVTLFSDAEKNYAACFCALGTTAGDAGGSKGRHLVDYGIPLECAQHLRSVAADTCFTFSLVTAEGASAKSGIAYNKTKGLLEDAVKAMNFPVLSIYRPGLLGRGDQARCVEKCLGCCISKMDVKYVGLAMCVQWVNTRSRLSTTGEPRTEIFRNKEIKSISSNR